MKVSATMCIAREDYIDSLNSLCELNEVDEVLLAPNEGYEDCCRYADKCFEVTPSKPWEPYGRHKLYDEAEGDWYLTLDDDDLAVESLTEHLDGVADDVSLVFGDVVKRFEGRHGLEGDVTITNDENFTPETANKWAGGYYALRAEAWEDIQDVFHRDYMVHGDGRMFYWLLTKGWSWKRIPKFTEVTHRSSQITSWGNYSPGWDIVVEHLERGETPEEWLLMDQDISDWEERVLND